MTNITISDIALSTYIRLYENANKSQVLNSGVPGVAPSIFSFVGTWSDVSAIYGLTSTEFQSVISELETLGAVTELDGSYPTFPRYGLPDCALRRAVGKTTL